MAVENTKLVSYIVGATLAVALGAGGLTPMGAMWATLAVALGAYGRRLEI